MNLQISASATAVVLPPSALSFEPKEVAVPIVEPRVRPDGAIMALIALIGGWALLAAGTLAALGSLATIPLAGH